MCDLKEARWLVLAGCLLIIFANKSLADNANRSVIQSPETIGLLVDSLSQSRIAFSSQWLALLQYEKDGKGYQSLISDPAFFLTGGGRHNPEAELDAMLRGVLLSDNASGDHMSCRFPARARYLRKELGLKENNNYEMCPWYDISRGIENSTEVKLVFPAPQPRGAGAMFGHILIRFDRTGTPNLLSPSINYAAYTARAGLAETVWKGLTGGFKGYYSLQPYYRKLNEYSEMEDRDLWEYRVRLAPDEVKMIALHAVELRGISTEYYFLDENCGYAMLKMLEVARPALELSRKFSEKLPILVIPSDIIQTAWSAGILDSPEYKASPATKINFLAENSSGEEKQFATMLLKNTDFQEVDTPKSKSYSLAAQTLKYRFSKLEITQEEFTEPFRKLSKVNQVATLPETPVPEPPHEGHSAGRISVGLGYGASTPYLEIGIRPAYHGLNEPPAGYPPASELRLFDIAGRLNLQDGSPYLQYFDVISMRSIAASNPFTQSLSWLVYLGGNRNYWGNKQTPLLFQAVAGVGKATDSKILGRAYLIATGSIMAGNTIKNTVAIGPGIEAGLLRSFNTGVYGNITGSLSYLGIGDYRVLMKADMTIGWQILRNQSVVVTGKLQYGKPSFLNTELSTSWQYYF